MQSLRETSIAAIRAVPGLFISDRFAARSALLLAELGIGFILSVTQLEDMPSFSSGADSSFSVNENTDRQLRRFKETVVMKQVPIDDSPREDLLGVLMEVCDWIDEALKVSVGGGEGKGVLVHCTQGISRSGAVVVGYLMRTLSLPYSSALSLARESRPLVSPNRGFEYQLRVWRFCGYDVFEDVSEGRDGVRKEKKAYRALRAEREVLMGRGEDVVRREMMRGLAGLAAGLGRRGGGRDEVGGEGEKGGVEVKLKGKGWERVERMEREWNRKLILGEFGPSEEEEKGEK